MGQHQSNDSCANTEHGDKRRREWVSPRISRMRATDAEAGPNPVVPEGIGFGS